VIRIVKMHFKQEHISDFLELFETIKNKIRNVDGCKSVTLLQSKTDAGIFFTYSHWQAEQDLENYRTSELFIKTWKTIKPWFAERGEAWSVDLVDE
jgi:(4S)-4-hydroxy-5-phosphonooxypentane-2,3-dione isomerase